MKKSFSLCASQAGSLGHSCCYTGRFRIYSYVSKRLLGSQGPNLNGSIVNVKKISKISTRLLPWNGWFCPVVSEPVKPYFTRFLRVLSFCLGVSKIVNFCGNGVVE